MAGPLLGIGDDRREALVQPAAPLGSRGAVDRRGQQRMCEANAARLGYEHAGLLGLEQAGAGVVLGSDGPEDQLARGPGQRRRHEAREPAVRRQPVHALARDRRAGLAAPAAGLLPRAALQSGSSARAISSARNGFPPDASASRASAGRGGAEPRRSRIRWWSAASESGPGDEPLQPMLRQAPARDRAARAPRDRPGG